MVIDHPIVDRKEVNIVLQLVVHRTKLRMVVQNHQALLFAIIARKKVIGNQIAHP